VLLKTGFVLALMLAPGAKAATAPWRIADGTNDAPGAPAPPTDIAKKPGNLSDKLNRNNGVIHPEGDIDPAMRKPAPPTGAMPVIPPPGAPGGDTTIQPK
jgi:hypothetical protein